MGIAIIPPWGGYGNSSGGKTILYGTGAPTALMGEDGDTYIDRQAPAIYGPKENNQWPPGVSFGGSGGSQGQMESTNSIEVMQAGEQTVALPIENPAYAELYVNGLLVDEEFFTILGKVATVSDRLGLLPGDHIEFTYEKGGGASGGGGSGGGGGGGSSGTRVDETPNGNIDGTNRTFLLAYTPLAGTLTVFQNGLLADAEDFSIAGSMIQFNFPPTGKIRAIYNR